MLVHGVGAGRRIWDLVLARLAIARRVICVDLPGFGETPPVGEGFDLAAVADRVAEIAGVPRFDLVGHSLGGAVAVALATRRPETVRRLVLVAPAGLAPRPAQLAEALGALAAPAAELRRVLGGPFIYRASARRLMFGMTVHDAAPAAPRRGAADARGVGGRDPHGGGGPRGGRGRSARGPRGIHGPARARVGRVGPDRGLRRPGGAGAPAARRGRRDAAPHRARPGELERPAAFAAALDRVLAALPAPD